MRSREMMARLDRLPKTRDGTQKVPDISLLSPEKQDRVRELLALLVGLDGTGSKVLYTEFEDLVGGLPLIGRDDPENGPLIEVPEQLYSFWQRQQSASNWRSLNFHKLGKVQTLRFVELCEQYGFRAEPDTPVKAQIRPLHGWTPNHRAELERLLDVAAS